MVQKNKKKKNSRQRCCSNNSNNNNHTNTNNNNNNSISISISSSSNGIVGKAVPSGVCFANVRRISALEWDPRIPAALRDQYAKPPPWFKASAAKTTTMIPHAKSLVQVQKIEDPSHPAFGQYGLFAKVNLAPKSFVIDYIGNIQLDEHVSPTSDYVIRFENGMSIDAEKMGNEARFINDFRNTGKKANVMFDRRVVAVAPTTTATAVAATTVVATAKDQQGQQQRQRQEWCIGMGVWVMSKPIKKGEELLISYGKGFWKARGLLRLRSAGAGAGAGAGAAYEEEEDYYMYY